MKRIPVEDVVNAYKKLDAIPFVKATDTSKNRSTACALAVLAKASGVHDSDGIYAHAEKTYGVNHEYVCGYWMGFDGNSPNWCTIIGKIQSQKFRLVGFIDGVEAHRASLEALGYLEEESG